MFTHMWWIYYEGLFTLISNENKNTNQIIYPSRILVCFHNLHESFLVQYKFLKTNDFADILSVIKKMFCIKSQTKVLVLEVLELKVE